MLRERRSRAALVASAAGLVGAVTMVGSGGDGTLSGDLMAVATVICLAAMRVIARARPPLPTLAAATQSSIWAPLACLPFATTAAIAPGNVLLMAGVGLITTSPGFGLFIAGSRPLPAVTTALIGALETPLTPLWVWCSAKSPLCPRRSAASWFSPPCCGSSGRKAAHRWPLPRDKAASAAYKPAKSHDQRRIP